MWMKTKKKKSAPPPFCEALGPLPPKQFFYSVVCSQMISATRSPPTVLSLNPQLCSQNCESPETH